MKRLDNLEPRLSGNPLRRWLLAVHDDLFVIHRAISVADAYYPESLTDLEKLVICLEDRRFFNHDGYDLRSLLREGIKAVKLTKHGGASTLDMQFVRTQTGFKRKTIGRKLYEIFLARLIQYRYSKILILRGYLRTAFFGSHLIGAEKASDAVFGKMVDSLTLDEAAFLASMLVYPRSLRPTNEWQKRVLRRSLYGVSIHVRDGKRLYQLEG